MSGRVVWLAGPEPRACQPSTMIDGLPLVQSSRLSRQCALTALETDACKLQFCQSSSSWLLMRRNTKQCKCHWQVLLACNREDQTAPEVLCDTVDRKARAKHGCDGAPSSSAQLERRPNMSRWVIHVQVGDARPAPPVLRLDEPHCNAQEPSF